jgi:hypothetical protein
MLTDWRARSGRAFDGAGKAAERCRADVPISAGNREGWMSGYMVATEYQGHRAFYMVNTDNPDFACGEVNKVTGTNGAVPLTPLSDETLKHFDVRSGQPWLSSTTDVATGEVTASRFGQEMAF